MKQYSKKRYLGLVPVYWQCACKSRDYSYLVSDYCFLFAAIPILLQIMINESIATSMLCQGT